MRRAGGPAALGAGCHGGGRDRGGSCGARRLRPGFRGRAAGRPRRGGGGRYWAGAAAGRGRARPGVGTAAGPGLGRVWARLGGGGAGRSGVGFEGERGAVGLAAGIWGRLWGWLGLCGGGCGDVGLAVRMWGRLGDWQW